jgi:hypothetical protein
MPTMIPTMASNASNRLVGVQFTAAILSFQLGGDGFGVGVFIGLLPTSR